MCPFCNISDTTEDINRSLLLCNTWKVQISIVITKLDNNLQVDLSTLDIETSVRVTLGGPLHTDDTRRDKNSFKISVFKWVQELLGS